MAYCYECKYCIQVEDHYECHAHAPDRNSQHELHTTHGWLFPRVNPNQRDCGDAKKKS
jgi:hypothetical protein